VNEAGLVQTLDAATGDVIASGDMKDTILGSPAVGADALYIRSDRFLWKIASPEK